MKKILLLSCIILFAASAGFAEIKVASVKGTAAFNKGTSWKELKAGMVLAEGTKISTGVRSEVVLSLSNSTVKIRPLSMMKIYEDKKTASDSSTLIALKRGGLRAEVNRMKTVKTVFRVATPVATSAVRGTIEDIASGPYGTSFSAPEGNFDVQDASGKTQNVSGSLSLKAEGNERVSVLSLSDNSGLLPENSTKEERENQDQNGTDSPDGGNSTLENFNNMQKPRGTFNLEIVLPQ